MFFPQDDPPSNETRPQSQQGKEEDGYGVELLLRPHPSPAPCGHETAPGASREEPAGDLSPGRSCSQCSAGALQPSPALRLPGPLHGHRAWKRQLNHFVVKTTNSRVAKQVSKISWHRLRCKSCFPSTPQGFRAGSDNRSEREARSPALGGT